MKKNNQQRKLRVVKNGVLETENRKVAFRATGQCGSLVTINGLYILKKHPKNNVFTGVARGVKVHVSIKSEILIFWA